MTIKTILLRWLCAAVLTAGMAGQALAAATVTSILVNGGSTANVSPGDTITVTVTVQLTSGSRWRSTAFSTSPGSSLAFCSLAPDISASGTFTRTFTMSAPSANGVFSLNVTSWSNPNCNGTASQTRTLPGGINTGPVTLTLNHVRLIHDGAALVCTRESLTLRACANAACTTLFTDNVSVSLGNVGTWSSNPVTISGGNATVTLGNGNAGTVTLSGTVTAPTASTTAVQCYRGSTAGDCALVFSNGSCSLDAVEVGRANNTPIFTKRIGGSLTLDVLALNSGVINTTATSAVSARLVTGSGTGCGTTFLSDAVPFIFATANAGRRTVTFTPYRAAPDVRVLLTSGTLVQCSSDNFTIRPSTLTVTSPDANADSSGLSGSATPVRKAGRDTFRLTATADGYTGTPLVNVNLVESAQAATGVMAVADAVPLPKPSVASTYTYSEVGYFHLLPYGVYDDGSFADVDENKAVPECFGDSNLGSETAPADPNIVNAAGKLGCYFGNTANTSNVGRFTPDHYALSDGSIVNRSAIAACAASEFSYLGEQLNARFTLTAQNADDETTVNYTGAFVRLNPITQLGVAAVDDPPVAVPPAVRTPFPTCPLGTPLCITPGPGSGSFADGVSVAPGLTVALTTTRGATRAGPFETFKVGVAPVDSDGVKIGAYDIDTTNVTAGTADHALVAATKVRYGRLNIDNAYGSELLNLTMKASAQYWSGAGYATNLLDDCTPLDTASFTMEDYIPGITTGNMGMSKVTSGGPLADGVGKFVLAKPGPVVPTSKGSVMLKSNLPYLPGRGRATFGVYKAGPVIYVRETY